MSQAQGEERAMAGPAGKDNGLGPEVEKALEQYLDKRADNVWKHFGPQWFWNIHENFNLIKELGPAHSVDELPKKLGSRAEMENIFIFASGASLTQFGDDLAKFKDQGLIFASPTQLQYLRYHGLEPDVLFSADSNETSQ